MERLVRYAPGKSATPWIVADPYGGQGIAAHPKKTAAVNDARAQVSRAGGGAVFVFSEHGVLESNDPVPAAPTAKSLFQRWCGRPASTTG